MIYIWSVCVGNKYEPKHVKNLYKMVKQHLKEPFQFCCLTDNDELLNDVNGDIFAFERISDKHGWWQKIDIFELSRHPSIYFDLDVVITKSLTPLIAYTKEGIAMPKNWALSGHGGYQSSVICWNGKARGIQWNFQADKIGEPEAGNFGYYVEDSGARHWGDQEYLTYHFKNEIVEIPAGLVVSYKYHASQALPKDALVVAFHGKPDYWEVKQPWIKL